MTPALASIKEITSGHTPFTRKSNPPLLPPLSNPLQTSNKKRQCFGINLSTSERTPLTPCGCVKTDFAEMT